MSDSSKPANVPAVTGEKVRVGTKIIKQLSTTFYPNHLIIFDELVANARDALASKVEINVQEDHVTIRDDGEGMTRNDLVRFFYIAHTKKTETRTIRSFKGVKRFIIGKFGIGKLSLYQICRSFNIETWKGGELSKASFDFGEFEKEEFVDEFLLNVTSEKTDRKGSGTIITLLNLKDTLSTLTIKRHLSKTMPLTSDFSIILSGIGLTNPITLKSEDLFHGHVHPIKKEKIPGIGDADGFVLFKRDSKGGDYGIYVRVYGRLVNTDDPHGLINLNDLNHSKQFDRRIYAEINVDGLNSALQTNRSGFIVSNPKYDVFKKWLKKTLNTLSDKEYEEHQVIQDTVEKNVMPAYVSHALSMAARKSVPLPKILSRLENLDLLQTQKGGMTEKQIEKHKPETKLALEKEPKKLMELLTAGTLQIEISELGLNRPEAVFDQNSGRFIINSDNPGYMFARSQGKLAGVVYHIFKASAVLIALDSSVTRKEFKEVYDRLTRDPEILEMLKQKWSRMGLEESDQK